MNIQRSYRKCFKQKTKNLNIHLIQMHILLLNMYLDKIKKPIGIYTFTEYL